jgi:hypothetical protein
LNRIKNVFNSVFGINEKDKEETEGKEITKQETKEE